ncbi:hypothetical protein [Metallosphaera sedula]|uniref:hypothetical protein n=1 Tax=Metallosphaera sedula TaxID=43687 RepID=UPI0020C16338|nr:hypothetical protein [Metallosphaera sedula]BBL48328.1 hypothetical protein MJ1HA_2450 [Metallosphaera sedula]
MQKIKKEGPKRELKRLLESLDDDTYMVVVAYVKNDMRAFALKRHHNVEII